MSRYGFLPKGIAPDPCVKKKFPPMHTCLQNQKFSTYGIRDAAFSGVIARRIIDFPIHPWLSFGLQPGL